MVLQLENFMSEDVSSPLQVYKTNQPHTHFSLSTLSIPSLVWGCLELLPTLPVAPPSIIALSLDVYLQEQVVALPACLCMIDISRCPRIIVMCKLLYNIMSYGT